MPRSVENTSETWRTFVLLVPILVASYIVYVQVDWPVLWLLPAWTILGLTFSIRAATPRRQFIGLNVSLALAFLTAAEVYAFINHPPSDSQVFEPAGEKLVMDHATLGYTGRPSIALVGSKHVGKELIYRVRYTLDERGMRIAKTSDESSPADCVLFFGGSFTFGEGVEDHEAMPSRFQEHTAGKFRALNFGLSGYGAHQMLAMLQEGQLDQNFGCTPRHFVYQHIDDHVRRAAGLAPWDHRGPRFEFDAAGKLVRKGQFETNRPPKWLRKLGRRSHATRKLISRSATVTDVDHVRLIAIVEQSKTEVQNHWPGASFTVLTWAERDSRHGELLQESDLELIWVGDVLPAALDGDPRYQISPHDDHPTPLAYEFLAGVIAEALTALRG